MSKYLYPTSKLTMIFGGREGENPVKANLKTEFDLWSSSQGQVKDIELSTG